MNLLPKILKIKVDQVLPEGTKIVREISGLLIDEPSVVIKETIKVDIVARKIEDDIFVEGSIRTEIELTCARCLKKFNFKLLKNDYERYFKKPKHENIDLTESIRADIMITLPIKSVCSEDCKGLCPCCGKDLNIGDCGCDGGPLFDPELSKLDILLDIDDSKIKKKRDNNIE